MKEKRFLYPVAFKTADEKQCERLHDALIQLGYRGFVSNYNKTYSLLVNNQGCELGIAANVAINSHANGDRHLCQSEEEFLALAASTNIPDGIEDEYFINTTTNSLCKKKDIFH